MLKEEVPGGARKFLQDKDTLLGKNLTGLVISVSRKAPKFKSGLTLKNDMGFFKNMCDQLNR